MNRNSRSQPLLLFIAYLGFISLGLPDTLIGVAWPSVRSHFDLPQSAVALIFFGSGCSYFFSSFFSGRFLKVFPIGSLLALSSGLVALSAFGYSAAPVWILFAACSLLHGFGSGAIDSGLNHYVAHHFSARHMNWLHACYSIGAMLGPLIMTSFIAWNNSWRSGYLVVAILLLSLATLFAVTRRRWDSNEESSEQKPDEPPATTRETLRHGLVWLHIALFFVYTGLEVTVGQWSFTVLTESRNVSTEKAGLWVTGYWASIAAGRILFGFIVERLGTDRLLRLSMLISILGTVLFALNLSDVLSAVALALTGLGLAAIFPCLMTRTPERFGKAIAAHAIGMQVSAAMLGAAFLPSVSGFLAQRAGLPAIATAAVIMALIMMVIHEIVLKSRFHSSR
ncbi:MAG: MFS transporter [Limisphaerales bacterium]